MSVFEICERTIGLIRGNRLMLTSAQRARLEALDYEGLAALKPQQEALSCARHFASVRDRMLQANPWLFARASVIPPLESVPLKGWPYSFTLPNDCLQLLMVVRQLHDPRGDRLVTVSYERMGNRAGCLYPVVEARYTRRAANTGDWDPLFADAFAYALAAAVTAGVTGEMSAAQLMEQGAMARVAEAVHCGAVQNPPAPPMTMGYRWRGFSDRFDPTYENGGDQI